MDFSAARELIGRQTVLLPDPVPEHPLLDGKKEIGRGEYSIVLDKGDGERVYKIVSSPADYFLYTAEDRPGASTSPSSTRTTASSAARSQATPCTCSRWKSSTRWPRMRPRRSSHGA